VIEALGTMTGAVHHRLLPPGLRNGGLILSLGIMTLVSAPKARAQALEGLVVVALVGEGLHHLGDISGGVSLLTSAETDGVTDRSLVGWRAGLERDVHGATGIVLDFAGQYASPEGQPFTAYSYQYLAGVRHYLGADSGRIFFHALFGGSTLGGGPYNEDAFMMGYGGGLDVYTSGRIGFRLFQVDWLPRRSLGRWDASQVRFGFSFILRRATET
jgi:hypothetical protein